MRTPSRTAFALLALLVPPLAAASCPDDAAVAAYVDDFRAARPSAGFGKDVDAPCARMKVIKRLGSPIGYKAVFTNPDSQRRFGVDGPAWGAMFDNLMLPSGARLPASFGALPRYESDFLVVVRDAGLADASSPREAMDHISALIPFLELPDLMITGKITGAELIAANAAFRGGVLGERIAVDAGNAEALLGALAAMEVVIVEERSGREIGREKGSVLMGNPVNATLWLAKALRADGIALRPGDLLSLGGFLGSAPAKAGTTISVRYLGLPGDPKVTVHFD